MGFFKRTSAGSKEAVDVATGIAEKKHGEGPSSVDPVPGETDATGNRFQDETQAGVRRVEATTTVWSKWHLVAAYAKCVCPYPDPTLSISINLAGIAFGSSTSSYPSKRSWSGPWTRS